MDDLTGLLTILCLFGLMPLCWALAKPMQMWVAQRERREARQLYERLTMEKLDVIKTAVAVGMPREDLADLDTRLERLIGADQMKTLLLQKNPYAPGSQDDALASSDLDREALAAAKRRAQRE